MIDPLLQGEIEKELDALAKSPYRVHDLYGIFFKGTMLIFTKSRVYKQPGRAKSELTQSIFYSIARIVNKNIPYGSPGYKDTNELKKMAKEAVDELIKDGIVEINKI
jgi:hypothetical protein